jgi:hypothetical protein
VDGGGCRVKGEDYVKKTTILAVLALSAVAPAAPLAAEESPSPAAVHDSQSTGDAAKKPEAAAEPAKKPQAAADPEKKPASDAAKKPKKPKKPAGPNSRARIFLNGAFSSGSIDFSQTRTFREFAEDGRVQTDYSVDSGLGFELGVHYKFNPQIGVMASFTTASRDSVLNYSASLPHPLFLDRDREVSGTEEGLSYSESAFHLDFVYTIQSGSLDVMFFAGPSYVDAKADVLSRLNYREAYPYDEVTVTSVDVEEKGDSGKTKKFGIGAQLRYTTASATIAPADGPAIEVDTGGLQVAAGVRLYF